MTSILVVSPIASHPPHSGARARIYATLKELKRKGHRVHFVYTACEVGDHERLRELMLQDWDSVDILPSGTSFEKTQGEDYGLDDWAHQDHATAIGDLARCYDVTHCLLNYVFQSLYFECLPEHVVRILDTHDKLSRRQLFIDMGVEPGFYYTTEEEELRGLTRADVILAIQDEETDYFSKSGKPVVVVGHITPFHPVERRFSSFKKIGYMGAVNKFNIHALELFIPAYAAWAAGCDNPPELSIAGNISKHFSGFSAYRFKNIVYEGFVADLGEYFESLDLYVNPTLVGTGLKIKSIEALAHGMPIVSTATGWDGLPGLPFFHDAKSIHDLIEAIDQVHREGFDVLTKLSNFSKANFTEYQYNLGHNLSHIFSADRESVLAWASTHPHYIGSRQQQNPDFVRLEDIKPGPVKQRPVIAHIVNPVRMPKTSDLYIAQPQAFRSLRFAQGATQTAEVVLVSKRFEEDAGYLDDCFDLDLRLTRSAQDLNVTPHARKLPLLGEVFSLDGIPDEVTHVVYTNSDIGVLPQFYDFLSDRFAAGEDAVVINRRTLPKKYTRADELQNIFTEYGSDHPGFDCFAVHRSILEKASFADTLVGVHLIGRIIFWNILARAEKIGYYPNQHLTFHIGDDVPSKGRGGLPYIQHNLMQGREVSRALQRDQGHICHPSRQEDFKRVYNVTPGEILGRYDPQTEPRNTVHMHSFFRAGSTYLYQKVRRQRGWTAFYEPLHEDLSLFSLDRLEEFKKRHDNAAFRHKADAKWHFAEFEGLLEEGICGIRGYDRRLSYMFNFVGAEEVLTRYINGLKSSTSVENVFLQFNRTALRQDQMRKLFPDDKHIYLQRDLRDLWGSHISFEANEIHGFLRNNLATLSYNSDHPLMQGLAQELPVAPVAYRRFFHQDFSEMYNHYTLEQHFLIHAAFWHAARIQAERHADFVINLGSISQDRLVRLEAETWLAAQRVDVSFADVKVKTYDSDALKLPIETMKQLEARALNIAEIAADMTIADTSSSTIDRPSTCEQSIELNKLIGSFRARDINVQTQNIRQLMAKKSWETKFLEPGHHSVGDMNGAGMFVAGFHKPEKDCIWASGQRAVVRLAIDPADLPKSGELDVTLHMKMHSTMVNRHMEVRIYADDTFLGEWRLSENSESYLVKIDVAQLRATAGRTEIGFFMTASFSGSEVEKRRMSLCLTGINIPALSNLDVSEKDNSFIENVHG